MGQTCCSDRPSTKEEVVLEKGGRKQDTTVDQETEFQKMIDQAEILDGPLKSKIVSLKPFTFQENRDTANLTLVSNNKITDGEAYTGFWYFFLLIYEIKGILF